MRYVAASARNGYSSYFQPVWWGFALVLALLFAVHFSFLVLANLPPSPLTAATQKMTLLYMEPYFGQRWTFFAPQPVDSTTNLLARGKRLDPVTHEIILSPWITVTEPLVDQVRKSRLAPLSLVQLGLSNVVIQYTNRVYSNRDLTKPDPNDSTKRLIVSPLPITYDPLDLTIMARTAAATLEIRDPGFNFTSVQLAISRHQFPRFTKRYETDNPAEVAILLIDWQDTGRVTPYCCSRLF